MVSPIALVAGPTEWPVVQLALAMLLAIIAHRCLEKNLPVVLRPLRPEG
jgi:hypothetical protein